MEEWKTYIASEFCSNVTDGTHDSPKPQELGHYLITSKHLKDNTIDFASAYKISDEDYLNVIKRSSVNTHDLLFSMIGTIGNVVRVTSEKIDFAVKNMAIFQMGGNELKSKWLYYWLKSPFAKKYINARLAGSTQAYLTLDSIRQFPISAPNENEMSRIISILTSLDDKIELNNRINHNLEEQAQALYKSWFVDFEPFKDGEFVESELGMIPKGWQLKNLNDLIEIKYGKDHKNLSSGKYPVYGSGGVMRYVEKYLYSGESVLIPRKGTLNHVMYVNGPFWSVDTMFYSVERIPNVAKYCFQILLGIDLSMMNAGSAVPSMTTDILNSIKVVLPDSNVLDSYNSLLTSLFQTIDFNRKENDSLAHSRDIILPKLMSGELKIDELNF